MAPEATTGLCFSCSCTGPTPSPPSGTHNILLPLEAGEAWPKPLEARVFLESCCFPSPGPFLLRRCPESCACPFAQPYSFQIQLGSTSSRKPTWSIVILHGKSGHLVAPKVHSGDLDPAFSL